MNFSNDFLLLSLPGNASPSHSSTQECDAWLERSLVQGKCLVSPFNIPEFKIGTLDSLVTQSEELAKIDSQLASAVAKTAEIMSTLNVDAGFHKVQDKSVAQYLEKFEWDSRKFKTEKSIKELIDIVSSEAFQLDTDVRGTYNAYSVAKTNLAAAERKKTGDLSVRSLHDIVNASDFVLGSEYLTTVLVAVPKTLEKEWLASYETLAPMVVPRSAHVLKEDAEFKLYNVTLFKKHAHEFQNAARENKYFPREFKYSEELIDELKQEHDAAASQEHSLRAQLVRLAKTAYSEIFVNWFHIKALRVFVESVLRYGLPPDFKTRIIRLPSKSIEKARKELHEEFGYLGGGAFSKDKNGKIKQDSGLHEYASLVDTEYEPFVFYAVEL